MDFDLSEWTVDSSAVQLNKQLFDSAGGPLINDLFQKHQLTPSPGVKVKKKKRQSKLQVNEDIPKKQRKIAEDNHKTDNDITDVITKKLKNETKQGKLKQLKSDEKIRKNKIKSDKKIFAEKKQRETMKTLKRKHDPENQIDAVSHEKIEKGKTKRMKKMKKENIENDNDVKQSSGGKISNSETCEIEAKKKRRKKKKNSSKKNKYKHLDEMRKAKTLSTNDGIVHAEQTTVAKPIKTCKGKSSQKKSNDEIVHSEHIKKSKGKSPKKKSNNEIVQSEQTTGVFSEDVKTHTRINKENSSQKKSNDVSKLQQSNKKAKELSKTEEPVKIVSEGKKSLSDFEKFKAHKTEKHNFRDDMQTKTNKKLPFKVSTLQKVLGDSSSSKDNSSSTGKIETGSKSTVNQVDKKEKAEHNPEKDANTPEKDKHKPPISLRERMMDQLKSARFRYINEQLYTQTGSEAVQLFKGDTEAFHCYHEGFQNQVNKWPTNPVDLIIKQIKAGASTAVIGDFGCGDAKIARSVPNKVHSFDLVALNEHVTVCNIEKIPLTGSSLDIAVFCLSLMGTNLVDYLTEANRVLKKGGTLMIAEVTSRIQKTGKFIRNIEKMGFQFSSKDTSNAMFILADFKKIGSPGELTPNIQLDPCVYKKR
ncbi:ribosomal RNA-processing protein 8-like isoform X2 [Mytilus californianus]|uniref:ribosomal RNA-processing protein 8-like isoform X2 n=1 Tax=Mytilus californianus TaxID=6549 RepID=UPI002248536A|nr:ribosomal RNA-processing protein 8-like isoform X2 [Mytilus californianus]